MSSGVLFKHEKKKQQVVDVLCGHCMYLYIIHIEIRWKNLSNVSGVKFVAFCAFSLPEYKGWKSPLVTVCDIRVARGD